MRIRLASILLFSILISAFAQTSIGFKNPENKTPLKDYRLPTWGHNTWQIYLDVDGNASESEGEYKHQGEQFTRSACNLRNQVSNAYRIFRESENYSLYLKPAIIIYHNYNFLKQANDEQTIKNETHLLNPIVELPFDVKFYFLPKHSIMLSGQVKYDYYTGTKDESRTYKVSRYNRKEFDYEIKLGYSFGRVRNVTPVIRALRFNERLQARSLGSSLSDEKIQQLARHFSKYGAYHTIYDRGSRYFWKDVDEIINLGDIELGDAFYLSECMSELIYDRFQGWALSFGMNYYKDEYHADVFNPTSGERIHHGPFLEFEWYHNFNLRSQFSFNINANYDLYKSGDWNQYEEKYNFASSAQYSWMIADRIIWKNSIYATNYYYFFNEDYKGYSSHDVSEDFDLNVGLTTRLEKRIEDRLRLDAYLTCRYIYNYKELVDEMWWPYTYKEQYQFRLYYGIRLSYIFDHHFK